MFGNGHPVLFLHGFLESSTMWDHLDLESFHFKSILIDLPGHGKSLNEDDNEPSISFMSGKVIEIINHLNIESFSVIGHSMGGYVALDLKKQLSNNPKWICNKVVLLNSNFWEDSESKKNDRLRVADIVFKNKNLFINEAVPNLFIQKETFRNEINTLLNEALQMDKHAISYASLAMRNRTNAKNVLHQFNQDFLVIQGALDQIVPVELMKNELSEEKIQLEVLNGVGHMGHFEAADRVKELISTFFKNQTK